MKLEVKHVAKSYGDNCIIKDVNLQLKEKEIISLLGVSGVGKTTLFHVISGIEQPDCGEILLDSQDITGMSGRISYMLQKDLLLPYRTIEDNVALPLIIQGMSKKEARRKIAGYFAEFGLEGTEKKYPAQLSGGMRQRAALLRTYLFSDGVALLDEPFSALDSITKGAMHQWYLSIMDKINLATIFVTHDIDEAILLSDRIYIMSGRPGHINHEIMIEEPRPRTDEFLVSSRFLDYKKEIISCLN